MTNSPPVGAGSIASTADAAPSGGPPPSVRLEPAGTSFSGSPDSSGTGAVESSHTSAPAVCTSALTPSPERQTERTLRPALGRFMRSSTETTPSATLEPAPLTALTLTFQILTLPSAPPDASFDCAPR